MGAEVSFERFPCDLRQLLLRAGRTRMTTLFQPFESLKHADRSRCRISCLDRQAAPFPVRFQFLVFGIAGLEHLDGPRNQLPKGNLAEDLFLLRSLGTMVVID